MHDCPIFFKSDNCGTVKPVLSDHIKHNTFLAFLTGGRLLLNESSEESSSFLRYFHSAISNHLSIVISMSSEGMVAQNRFDCMSLYSEENLKNSIFNGTSFTEHQMKNMN